VYAPRVPAERTPNHNPTVDGLTINEDPARLLAPGRCGDPTTTPNVVAAEEELLLTPIEPDGVRETYVVPTLDGMERQFTESLTYQWLASAGGFSAGSTGGPRDPFGNPAPLFTDWTAPAAKDLEGPTDVSFWFIQRDERLGLAWYEACLRVVPE
jgi:hypothetical protein